MMTDNINYTIYNHSDIISIDLLKECYEHSLNTHWRYRTKEYIINQKKIGCYLLYDENKKIIYIGKSSNSIRSRLLSHCFAPISVYLKDYEKDKILLKRKLTRFFSYIEVDKHMIDFVERGLINKYQPILNVEFIHS